MKLLWEVETIHYEVQQFGTHPLSQGSQGAFTVNIAILHVCMCVYDSVKMHRLGFNYFELICQSNEFFCRWDHRVE